MLLFMKPKTQVLTIRELMTVGQLHWLIVSKEWRSNPVGQEPDRLLVMVKYALTMLDKVDPQAHKLLLGMIRTNGHKYPKTPHPSPLCLWDYWFELIHGPELMLPEQYRMPPEMRALLKDQFNQAGLGVVNTKNNIQVS